MEKVKRKVKKITIIITLIVIARIILIYLYFNNINGNYSEGPLSKQDEQTQNSQFEDFLGDNKTTIEVKLLCSIVRNNNVIGQTSEELKKVYLIFTPQNGKPEYASPTTIQKNVKKENTYNVEILNDKKSDDISGDEDGNQVSPNNNSKIEKEPAYYTSGYIKIISIKENKSNSNTTIKNESKNASSINNNKNKSTTKNKIKFDIKDYIDIETIYLLFIIATYISETALIIYTLVFLRKSKNQNIQEMNNIKENLNMNNQRIIDNKYYNKYNTLFIVILIIQIIFIFWHIFTYETFNITVSKKPIIYLYPEQEEKVSVEAIEKEKFIVTYPTYKDVWNVIAKPNGDLIDKKTNRNLYCLYYESKGNDINKKFYEGFCVKGEDTTKFLEEKLSKLGLTEREANEFIIYWLPQMQNNKYNLIKFLTTEEVEKAMPLKITPNPDTKIRILMVYKSVNKEIKIPEQKIETPTRTGFTMVEWGGTEIK